VYAELHCHSYYSFLEAASAPEALVRQAAELGLPALALTDHNGLYGMVKFHQAAQRAGLHAIIGAEVTLDGGGRLILLAEDRQGYTHLSRLLSKAQLDHQKGSPAIAREALAPFSPGLIALAAGPRGELAQHLLAGRPRDAEAALAAFQELFGRDRFYVELQHHLEPADDWLCAELAALAHSRRAPLIAANNVHYATRAERALQDVLVAIKHRTTLDASQALRRINGEYALQDAAAMQARLAEYPEALASTVEVAQRCQVSLDFKGSRFPGFPVPPGETPFSYLYQLCQDGVRRRYRPITSEVSHRLQRELEVIEKTGLAEFFLINWDIMQFAAAHGIPGQGRGSAADSIVAYLLGITRVDPVEHNLLFERFLHEEMTTTPDIDIDFSTAHREQIIQYVYEKYGPERTGMVCNVVTFQPRSAIRQVGKALGFPEDLLDRLAKSVDRWGLESPAALAEAAGQEIVAGSLPWEQFFTLVEQIQGVPRHLSIHVGGMLVTGEPLIDIVPVERATMPGRVVVQFNKDDVEDLGLIKMDMLGLRTLSVVAETLDQVQVLTGVRPDLDALDLKDPRVYDLCCQPDTIGVFQVESRAQMQTLPRARPRAFGDLIVEVAIIRPGPIQGNAVSPYLKRRSGQEPVRYLHPALEPILNETLGVILFQEQILRIAMEVAGFTAAESDRFRRAINRHRSRLEMESLRESFLAGTRRRQIPAPVGEELFRAVAAFAEFGFCKSHAAAFARTCYETAWLKLTYPAAFYVGLLNNQPMGFYAPHVLVEDAKRHGIAILPVDVNRSRVRCHVEGAAAIRLGFNYVQHVGDKALERLEAAARDGPYDSLATFVQRTRLPRDAIESLILAGAFDAFEIPRRRLLWELPLLLERLEEGALLTEPPEPVTLPALTALERTALDYRILGLTPGPHVITYYRPQFDAAGVVPTRDLRAHSDRMAVRVGGLVITRQAPGTAHGFRFFTLADEWGHVDITFRPDVYQRFRRLAREPVLVIDGILQKGDGGVISVLAQRVTVPPRPVGPALQPSSHDYH